MSLARHIRMNTHYFDERSELDPSELFHEPLTPPFTRQSRPVPVVSSNERLLIPSQSRDTDAFLRNLYEYYHRGGLTCVILARLSFLIRSLFSIVFTLFVINCVNWSHISNSDRLSAHSTCGIVPASFLGKVIALIYVTWWTWTAWNTATHLKRMLVVKRTWDGQLGLPSDVRFISWTAVMHRYRERMDTKTNPHHIINRIMRWDNYFIAMLTRDVLGLERYHGLFFTKLIEWHLKTAIQLSLFRQDEMLIQDVMMYNRRVEYTNRLKVVFKRMGLVSLVTAPLFLAAFVIYFAYRHVSEYRHNPRAMVAHSFTPLARWKLRDFNELPHLYTERLQRCHPKILEFMAQYESEEYLIISRCISFMLGAILLFFIIASLIDSESTVRLFGIDKPILFYTGITGALFVALQRDHSDTGSSSPAAGESPFFAGSFPSPTPDPEKKFEELAKALSCLPVHWKDMTTKERYEDIRKLFRHRWTVFLPELFSVLLLPFLFFFHCPSRAANIVSFFRENSLHVEHTGIVCSCAIFQQGQRYELDHEDDLDRKMLSSFANFKQVYPEWSHSPEQSEGDDDENLPPWNEVGVAFDTLRMALAGHQNEQV